MKVRAVKTSLFTKNANLIRFIQTSIPSLKERSILVVTSKVVSLSEGRTASPNKREELIKKMSASVIKTKYVWLTYTDGLLMANAGIDDSNGNGTLVLLPKNAQKSAEALLKALKKIYKRKHLGVIITDSTVQPLRAGVVGVALGYAGFEGVKDYRGTKDLYGRVFTFSQTNVADSLATAANVVMGEGSESQPLAVIEGAPVGFTTKTNPKEMSVSQKDDMYAPLLKNFLKKKK